MAVKTIRRLPDGVALIEWKDKNGMIARGYVPAEIAQNPSKADLKAAVPFGDLDESAWPRLVITPKRAKDALNKKGIWTQKQLNQSPHLRREAYATAALQVLRNWEKEHPPESGR